MLKSDNLIQDIIKHFPRWMDIRKRYFSSNGGQLLTSMTKEVEEIQTSINEYVDSFFIPYYEDKCDKITSFVYKANIGNYDINKLCFNSPAYKVTDNIKTFYLNNDFIYYQDGFVFTKEALDKVFYSYKDFNMEATLEKMHVWNVYDEFAAFIGIQRYEDEDNAELYNRIIFRSKNIVNSSEDGLKNAILTALCNKVPELSKEDIVLERPTATNLVKYYNEFESALEKLIDINKDVLRVKKWDVDLWQHDFAKIDYIPYVWDVQLDDYENGIGDNDDLRPAIINANKKTDAKLSFYRKSESVINDYIANKDIDENLNLQLERYSNVLKPFTANYQIIASEALELKEALNNKPIIFEAYKKTLGEKYRFLNELVVNDDSLHNVEKIKQGKLEKGKYYRVKFSPKDKYSSMKIYNCFLEDDKGNISVDLKDDKKNEKFYLDGTILTNTSVKKSVSTTAQTISAENIIDTSSGMSLESMTKEGKININVDGCSGELLKVLYDCKMSSMLKSYITLNNYYCHGDKYISDTIDEEKSLELNLKANKISFKVKQGQCNIICFADDEIIYNGPPKIKNGEYTYESSIYNSPKNMRVSIYSLGQEQTIISDLSYACYELKLQTEKSILINSGMDKAYYIPAPYNNNLIIKIRSYTQYSPIIQKVFIGKELDRTDYYESDLICCDNENLYLNIKSNCNVELYESTTPFVQCLPSSEVNTHKRYSTDVRYVAKTDDAYIVLNLNDYIEIKNVLLEQGRYEVESYGNMQKHFIKLLAGQSVSGILIDGVYNKLIQGLDLDSILSKKLIDYNSVVTENTSARDKIYINKLLKKMIIEKPTGEQIAVSITKDDFNVDKEIISSIKILNLPDNVQSAFVTALNENKEHIFIGCEKSDYFDTIFFYPKEAKEYVANNETVTYSEEKKDIEIINTFNNNYVDNKLMIFKVNTHKDAEFALTFDNNKEWTVGKRKMILHTPISYDTDNFNITKKSISEKVTLGSTVPLKSIYTTDSLEKIEIDQYNIVNDSDKYEVIYDYDISSPFFDKVEYIQVKNDGFNKLRYCNVMHIKYIGKEPISGEEFQPLPEQDYEIMEKEGIVIWKNKDLIKNNAKLYIVYSIKKAIAVKFNIEYLYDKVQYAINSYEKIGGVELKDIRDKMVVDLTNPTFDNKNLNEQIKKYYQDDNVVYVECSEPGFQCSKSNEKLLFNKVASENSLAVKSGWYYLYGKEYYMFATNQSQSIVEDEVLTIQDVDKVDNTLYLHKKTKNFVKNSKMLLGSLANTYNITDFNKLKQLKGASAINAITACDSYNHWQSFAMKMSLGNGLNGLGLQFESLSDKDISYSLLDITEYLCGDSHISFFKTKHLDVYLGRRKVDTSVFLTDTTLIDSLDLIDTKEIDNIYSTSFKKDDAFKYYLVVRGEGLLDDIIIQDVNSATVKLHKKNIDRLKFKIQETMATEVISRIYLDQHKGNKNNGAEIDCQGYITNASNIDWNVTKIKTYTTKQDWMNECELKNVDVTTIDDKDCAVMTKNEIGKITTKPIYIGNPKAIKNVIFKVNKVPLKSMQGFKIKLLQSQGNNGFYMPCILKHNEKALLNYSSDLIYPYVKLSVEMAECKVIDSIEIYIEYKSTEQACPVEKIESNGEYITRVLDTSYSTNYKLKHVEVEDSEGSFELFVRAAKEKSNLDVWTDWYKVIIKDGIISNDINFKDCRYFQLKAKLSGQDSKVKIKYVELEVN